MIFFDTGTIAQLKGLHFYLFFNSSPTRTPVSSRREVHARLHRSNADEEPRKATQSDAGEDRVPSVVDGLIGSGLF